MADSTDKQEQNDAPWEFKPGESISPASMSPAPLPKTDVKAETNTSLAPQPDQADTQAPVNETPQIFPGNQRLQQSDTQGIDEPLVSWSASEFIRHEKSSDWYLALVVVDIIAAVLVYLIFKDVVTTVVVVLVGIGFGFNGWFKPKQQDYVLGVNGLSVGQRYFMYNEFRSFAIYKEGAFTRVQFVPLKRFGTPVNIYFDPQDQNTIMQVLGSRLPMEEAKHDPIDNLMKRIRF